MRSFCGAALAGALLWGGAVSAGEPVRIGELFSYNAIAAFALPYRQGWQLAQEEINAAGGVLDGRPLQIISRDDGGTTGDAVRVAEDLVSRENVEFLFGTFFSNIGLAVADFANQRRMLFLATEPLTDALNLEGGNRFTFRIRPSTFMQTSMLVDEAVELGATRWAIVAPNYEYGQAAAAAFRRLAAERLPGAEIVVEQFPTLGQLQAGPTIAAIERARPDAIFNALFGADLARFVREGAIRGTFEGRHVLSLLTGEPEYLIPLGDEAPEGWIVTGYPWDQIDTPEHRAFVEAYMAAYGDTPRLASLLGYVSVLIIRDMLEEAGSTDTEAMIAALERIAVATPQGPISFRAIDNQATAGAWVGRIAVEEGRGRMVDWVYKPGPDHFLPEDEVLAVRQD
ncbi:MAG: twin-arginine translocation pathway signal protein [Geminicoccaceae bacterium]|nr:MAG: twin-arginine translocation pathway signal protein [Geminicoccaceae bacterium]